MRKITVIGGGTGTFMVLNGLKHYDDLELTAIVAMTDSGGSTGRLRDEFGTLPVGDVRQCLVALAKEDDAGELLRKLFLYRFPDSESSLSGHNFGNLFLTALTDILGSEEDAISAVSDILSTTGEIAPITTDKVELVAKYSNGEVLIGEKHIDEPNPDTHDCTLNITELWTEPQAEISPAAKKAILEADVIIMGPGDLYSSLLSNIVISGVPEALKESNAKFIYITNLVSKYGQTHGLTTNDYITEIERYTQRNIDHILQNNTPLPNSIVNKYKRQQNFPIEQDLNDDPRVLKADIISSEEIKQKSGDIVKRSLLRHDSFKLARELYNLIARIQ